MEHGLGDLRLREADTDGARAHLHAALTSDPSAATASEVRADLALCALHDGDLDTARTEAEAARDAASEAGSDRALVRAHTLLGMVARRLGQLETARDHLRKGLALASTDPESRVGVLNNLGLVHADADAPERAIATFLEALVVCDEVGDRHRAAAVHNNIADLFHATGRPDQARTHQRAAAEAFAEVSPPGAFEPGVWMLVDW